MKYGEIKDPEGSALPKAVRSEVRKIWFDDFWDVPRNGLALYRGEKLWFESVWADPLDRRFWLMRLAPDQLAEQERLHELYRQHIGTDQDFAGPGFRSANSPPLLGAAADETVYEEARETHREKCTFRWTDAELVAWFDDLDPHEPEWLASESPSD